MTALELFCACEAGDRKIQHIKERIDRRRALATSCTTRPLSSADGGGFGSNDASMRMVDYVADLDSLDDQLRDAMSERDRLRLACLYVAEMLPITEGAVAVRHYVQRMKVSEIAKELSYSETHVRRLQKQADECLKHILILHWDAVHVPIVSIRTEGQNEMDAGESFSSP